MAPTAPKRPKIELHVHIEATGRVETMRAITAAHGLKPPERRPFTDLYGFIDNYNAVAACLRAPADYRTLILAYAAEAAEHGAVYLEPIVCADESHMGGADGWREIIATCCDAADEASDRYGIDVNLTPDIYRGADVDFCHSVARSVATLTDRRIVGFGLSGREGRAQTAPYLPAVRIAQDAGLGFVPHAGEAAGPASIREVMALSPARIRHGVRAVEDPELVAEIAQRQIVLDVTPTSNLLLGVTESMDQHPLPRLRAADVLCSISTDDPALFDTDLTREHELAERLGLSPADAYTAGAAGALCDEATRDRLRAIGKQAYG